MKVNLCCLFILFTTLISATNFNIVTEHYPPFNYVEKGEIKGISTEILKEVLEDAQVNYSIKILPWARAYNSVLSSENFIIYSILKNSERENLFHWIGPFAKLEIGLYKLKNRTDIQINSIEDIKKYKLGLMRDDATTDYFIKRGFKKNENFILYPSTKSEIKLALAKRIDLFPSSKINLSYMANQQGFSFNDFEMVYPLFDDSEFYFAINKNTKLSDVKKIRKSFEKLIKNGKITEIHDKYIK